VENPCRRFVFPRFGMVNQNRILPDPATFQTKKARRVCRLAIEGFAAKGHVIVHIEQVEPRRNVLALGRGLFLQAVEKLARFHVHRHALFGKRRPRGDFQRRAFVFRVFSIHARTSPSLLPVPFSMVRGQCRQIPETAGRAGRRSDIRRFCRRAVARPLSSMRGRIT
jgi:hypothetical protein